MRVTVTGATGRIGTRLVSELRRRGDEVTVLSRNPDRARAALGVEAVAWDPEAAPAPVEALAGRDGVIHLAGEDVAQRWSAEAKRRLVSSRELGTRNLVAGLEAADPRPGVLVSSSAIGWYGHRGDEPLDESAPAADDFLAQVCAVWEREAAAAERLGVRVARIRTGVVLDKERRRAGQDAPVLQARRRRAGRGRPAVHELDPRRRPRRRSTSRRSTAARAGAAPSTGRRPPR